MWVNEGTPSMSFVLYTINVEYLCDASYVTWKYRQYRRYHVIFVRKYKIFQKLNTLRPDSIVVEPHFLFIQRYRFYEDLTRWFADFIIDCDCQMN